MIVRVGSDSSSLIPIRVNCDSTPVLIDGPHFTGYVTVRIASPPQPSSSSSLFSRNPKTKQPLAEVQNTEYFKGKSRLFSFQSEGRYKPTNPNAEDNLWTGEDVLFVAQFKDKIFTPPGTNVAIRIAKMIDGAFFADHIFDEQPFVGSYLLAGMNTVRISTANKHGRRDSGTNLNFNNNSGEGNIQQPGDKRNAETLGINEWQYGGSETLKEDVSLALTGAATESVAKRRSHFCNSKARKEFRFQPDMIYGFDFFNNYLDLRTPSLKLGVTIACKKAFNGMPLTFVARAVTGEIFYMIEIDYDSS